MPDQRVGKSEAASKGEPLCASVEKPVLLKTIRVTKLTFDEVAVTGRDPLFEQESHSEATRAIRTDLPAVMPGFSESVDDLGRTR